MAPALVGVFYDDGIYLALGRSLAEGGGYRVPYLPGAPAAVHYPIGYPALLAALWTLWPAFPANVALLKGANAALLGAFATITVRALAPRVGIPAWLVALLVVAGAAAVPLMAVSTVLFAEPLFLALVALACWAADSAREADGRRSRLLGAAAGALAGCAALTRSIGVAAIGAVALALARRRPRAALAAGTAGAALFAPWVLWSVAHADGIPTVLAANYGTYGQFLAQAGVQWWSPASLLEVVQPLGALALPPLPALPRVLAGAATLGVATWGLVAAGRGAPAMALTVALYGAVVSAWPYGPSRFVWILVPWALVAFAVGARDLFRRAARAPQPHGTILRGVLLVLTLALATTYALRQGRGLMRGAPTAAQRGISATFAMVLPWIREQTDTAAVIATEDEALVWLYTGRRAVPSYLWRVRGRGGESFGADSLQAFLDRSGATHLVLTGPDADAAADVDALLGRHPGYLRVVHVWPGRVLAFAVARAERREPPR